MNKTVTMAANEVKEYKALADFFRVLAATSTLTVRFYYQGRQISEAEGVELGYAEEFVAGPFDAIQIENGPNAQTLQFVTRLGSRVAYDKSPVGNVFVTNTGGAFVQGRTSVGSGAVSQLMAANAIRRRIFIQNNTAGQFLRLTFDGSDPTAANGLRLVPGDLLDVLDYCPTGAVKAIFESGAAASVEWLEG